MIPSPPEHVSAAQHCPDDVLDIIFAECAGLGNRSLLSVAALVCQRWLSSARARLYYEVHVDTTTARGVAAARSLAYALRTNPALLSFIRHVFLRLRHDNHDVMWLDYSKLCDWIQSLPAENVKQLSISTVPDTDEAFQQLLVATPMFTSVPILELGQGFVRRLSSTATETVALKVEDLLVYPNRNKETSFARFQLPLLKKLHIVATHRHGWDSMVPLLAAICTTVVELDLRSSEPVRKWDTSFISAISTCSNLTRLHYDVEAFRPEPFIEDILPCFLVLEYLRCPHGSYDHRTIFEALPTTLKVLKLEADSDEHNANLRQASLVLLERIRRGDLALNHFNIITHLNHKTDLPEIQDSFRSAGVEFSNSSW